MAKAPIMPFFTDAYLADTNHLSTLQHGIYLLLLLYMWRHNGVGLPDDDVALAKIVRLPLRRWQRERAVLAQFFEMRGGMWVQKRLDRTWRDVEAKIERQREKGKRKATLDHDKRLKDRDHPAAAAQPTNEPSSSIHEPSSDGEKEENMFGQLEQFRSLAQQAQLVNFGVCAKISVPAPATSQLSALITDHRYYSTRTPPPPIPPRYHALIVQAMQEVSAFTQPMGQARSGVWAGVVVRRYPAQKAEAKAAYLADLTAELAGVPEDRMAELLETLLRAHAHAYPPLLSQVHHWLEPQAQQRRNLLKNVSRLHEIVTMLC